MRDIEVRSALHRKVLAQHKSDPDTLVVDELGLCQGDSRVDVAVINGEIHGIEIKSDKDTLTRLPAQVTIYSTVLDRVTLVVGERHLAGAEKIIPDWWGVKVVTAGPRGGIHFKQERPAQANPAVDPYALAQLLWRNEALDVLERKGAAKGLKSKPRAALWKALAEVMTLIELSAVVRATLKARSTWRSHRTPSRGGG